MTLNRPDFLPGRPLPKRPDSKQQAGLRALILAGLAVAVLGFTAIALSAIFYLRFAADLPPAGELHERAAPFRSMRIYDREGRLLNEAFDPEGGRRRVVPLSQISPYLAQATIATEDASSTSTGA